MNVTEPDYKDILERYAAVKGITLSEMHAVGRVPAPRSVLTIVVHNLNLPVMVSYSEEESRGFFQALRLIIGSEFEVDDIIREMALRGVYQMDWKSFCFHTNTATSIRGAFKIYGDFIVTGCVADLKLQQDRFREWTRDNFDNINLALKKNEAKKVLKVQKKAKKIKEQTEEQTQQTEEVTSLPNTSVLQESDILSISDPLEPKNPIPDTPVFAGSVKAHFEDITLIGPWSEVINAWNDYVRFINVQVFGDMQKVMHLVVDFRRVCLVQIITGSFETDQLPKIQYKLRSGLYFPKTSN